MSELRAEAISLIDEVPTDKLDKLIDLLKNFLRDEDPFWSEENQKYLRESIREMKEGKVVTFTDEEWEKFINAQNI
ncbi:MAG: hypothetical protein IJS29_04900 [Selenomonadaceae bacterium]|nr:hypothetical protein [Selenomonadaceae bacterium]